MRRSILVLILLLCGSVSAQVLPPDPKAPVVASDAGVPAPEAPDAGVAQAPDVPDVAAPVAADAGLDVTVAPKTPDLSAAVLGTDGGVTAPSETPDAAAVEAPDAGGDATPVAVDAGEPAKDTMDAEVATPATSASVGPGTSVPKTDAEASATLKAMADAAKNGQWNVLGGLMVLLLVWLFNRMGLVKAVGAKAVPWIALGTGALVAIALGMTHGAAFSDALKLGLLDGALAVGLWELLGKHFLPSGVSSPPPPAE